MKEKKLVAKEKKTRWCIFTLGFAIAVTFFLPANESGFGYRAGMGFVLWSFAGIIPFLLWSILTFLKLKKTHVVHLLHAGLIIAVAGIMFVSNGNSVEHRLRQEFPALSNDAFNRLLEVCENSNFTEEELFEFVGHTTFEGMKFLRADEKKELRILTASTVTHMPSDDRSHTVEKLSSSDYSDLVTDPELPALVDDTFSKLSESDSARYEELINKSFEYGLLNSNGK